MTTLPTTSSIRLPRAGGPGGQVLAMPAAAMGMPASQAQEPFLTPADFWRVIRRNWLMIFVSLLVATAIGLALYYFQLKYNPRYTSTGQVIITPPVRVDPKTQTAMLSGDEVFDLRVEMRTQMTHLMTSQLWLNVMENNPKIKDTSWYKNFEAISQKKGGANGESEYTPASLAKADLLENFKVTPQTDTKILKITMEAPRADDARDVLQYIVDAHIAAQHDQAYARTRADMDMAKQWKLRYDRELNKAVDDMNAAKGSLGGISTEGGRPGGVVEMQLSEYVGQLIKAKIELSDAQGLKDAYEKQIAANDTPAEVDQAVRNDPTVLRLQGMEEAKEQEIAGLTTSTGSNSRQFLRAQAELDNLKAELANATRKARITYRETLINGARSRVDSLQSTINALNEQIEGKRGELDQITQHLVDYYSAKEHVETYRVLQREMEDRIAALNSNLSSDRIGIQWASNGLPDKPDFVSSPRLSIYLPGALMIGLVFSLGIAFLREIMDTTVKSPRDIVRVGPMNVLGMITDESDDPQVAGIPLHAVIGQAPHSLMAEQFRQVRTRLQHAASLDTTRTIVITSPGPGDGKSMVACNLAAGLALNGRRILLVDANFRRPELHRLFGLQNETGFSNVLDSVSNLETAVQKSSTPNLDVLTTGPKASNPTELLESQLFSDFIDRALEEYDHVIFDTGPLLVVSEAVALAPRVDGVITVVRARVNSRGMLTRVRDTLKQIKAEHVGVVLNGVQTWGGGYYGRNIKTYYDYQNSPK